jgi:hypothetical protein
MEWTITSLFPGYLFACFDLQQRYFKVRYMPGVQGIVSAEMIRWRCQLRLSMRSRAGARTAW